MPFGLDEHFYKYVLALVMTESILFTYAFTSDVRTCQVVLGLVGLWWCFAALWVEVKIEQTYPGFQYEHPSDPKMREYKPFCDFAPWATCSKVLMSPPGRLLRFLGIAKPHHHGPGAEAASSSSLLERLRCFIDVPNPTLGVLFFSCHLLYPAFLLLPVLGPSVPWLALVACCGVGCMTVWLAYNLVFVLRDFCVVCVSMYVANFALIPMMYSICQQRTTSIDDFVSFFGSVPKPLLYPFLALDIVMGLSVLVLYCRGPPEKSSAYQRMPGGA